MSVVSSLPSTMNAGMTWGIREKIMSTVSTLNETIPYSHFGHKFMSRLGLISHQRACTKRGLPQF